MALYQRDSQILLKEFEVYFENFALKLVNSGENIAEIVFFSYNPKNKNFQIVLKNFNIKRESIVIGNITCRFNLVVDDITRIKYNGNIEFLGAQTIGSIISLTQLK
jgi:hypothetical protein